MSELKIVPKVVVNVGVLEAGYIQHMQHTSIIDSGAVAHRKATDVPSFSYESASVISPKVALGLVVVAMFVMVVAYAITFRGGLVWDHNVAIQSLKQIF